MQENQTNDRTANPPQREQKGVTSCAKFVKSPLNFDCPKFLCQEKAGKKQDAPGNAHMLHHPGASANLKILSLGKFQCPTIYAVRSTKHVNSFRQRRYIHLMVSCPKAEVAHRNAGQSIEHDTRSTCRFHYHT